MKIKTLVLSNGVLEEKEIHNTLEDLQKIVDGYIEMPYISRVFAENDIDIVINEEGKLIEGMKPEIAIISNHEVLDIVYGNCIFVSHNEDGETTSLTEAQMDIVKEELNRVIVLMNEASFDMFNVRALFI